MLPHRHEVLGPGLHRFVFPSRSRPGVEHELLVDMHDTGAGRLSCLCEAALFGKLCKHKRAVIRELGRALRRPSLGRSRAKPKAWARVRRLRRRRARGEDGEPERQGRRS